MSPSINMPYFSLYFDLRPIVTFHVLLHLCGFQRTSELMHLCVNIQLQICHKKTKNSPNPVRGDFEGSKILISENHSIRWTQAFSALLTSYFFFFSPQQQSSCALVTENLSWYYESSYSHCSTDSKLNRILVQAGGKWVWRVRESQDADALKQSIS